MRRVNEHTSISERESIGKDSIHRNCGMQGIQCLFIKDQNHGRIRMKLKEIEMDLPYKRDDTYFEKQEMIDCEKITKKEDYITNWKGRRREFQLMTRCMTSMVERIMKPLDTEDCWKIIIECIDGGIEDGYKNLLGIYVVQVSIDLEGFWRLNELDKKRATVKKILDGIRKLSNYVSFGMDNIYKACEQIEILEYNNIWYWKKPIKYNQKYVQIMIQHEINILNIYMVFMDIQKNPIEKILLTSTLPDERKYAQFLGELKWISEMSAVLITKANQKFYGEISDV